MNGLGSADVDVFPMLELYARLAAFAGLTDIVGPKGGIEAQFSLLGANGELRLPSELGEAYDASNMKTQVLKKRDHYRETLMDATFSALTNIDRDRVAGGASSVMSPGNDFVPSHSLNFVTADGHEVKRKLRHETSEPLLMSQ
jgi:hypothetical protein